MRPLRAADVVVTDGERAPIHERLRVHVDDELTYAACQPTRTTCSVRGP